MDFRKVCLAVLLNVLIFHDRGAGMVWWNRTQLETQVFMIPD